MRDAKSYEVVRKYPFFEGYVERFGRTSIDNDIPAMLSFFFVQGQIAAKYVRIPWDGSHLDPRVHVFWIQPSRTGKSIAWEFIGDVLKDCGIESTGYTAGTDAGLIGGVVSETVTNEHGKKEQITVQTKGMLGGQKALNFDEGSVILDPGQHSKQTVLYLQQACNPIGSNSNILEKHMSGRTISTESLASLWITTYPPKGVKDYVLTKGIFQRVLLFWSHWSMDRRMGVSMVRMEKAFTTTPKTKVDYEDIVNYFTGLEKRLLYRVLKLTDCDVMQWDEMDRDQQEELVQSCMDRMFTVDETFRAASYDVVEDFYSLLNDMEFALKDIVSSFLPAMENYSVILATHIAMMDDSWVVTGEHLDMAKDILYDLFKNLISWLEGEVEIGSKDAIKSMHRKDWMDTYQKIPPVELDKRGEGWRAKSKMIKQYQTVQQVTRGTAWNRFNKWAQHLFDTAKDGKTVYLRLKDEVV
tara:strand:+ start:31599 stop:33005 length:1407 start_codon:yes stop_codon:yes gene_type:complete